MACNSWICTDPKPGAQTVLGSGPAWCIQSQSTLVPRGISLLPDQNTAPFPAHVLLGSSLNPVSVSTGQDPCQSFSMNWYLVVSIAKWCTFLKEEELSLGNFRTYSTPTRGNTSGSMWSYISSNSNHQNPRAPLSGGQQAKPGTKWRPGRPSPVHHVPMMAGVWDPDMRRPVPGPTRCRDYLFTFVDNSIIFILPTFISEQKKKKERKKETQYTISNAIVKL